MNPYKVFLGLRSIKKKTVYHKTWTLIPVVISFGYMISQFEMRITDFFLPMPSGKLNS